MVLNQFERNVGRMKFSTVNDNGQAVAGLIDQDLFYSLEVIRRSSEVLKGLPTSLQALIEESETWLPKLQEWVQAAEKTEGKSIDSLIWLAPLPRPHKNIFCVGKNYAAHATEFDGGVPPEDMIVFTKAPTAVNAHKQVVPLHTEVTNELDYEGELAIVIGKKGTSISREKAYDHVFGYTILNDITARDLQSKHQQYFLGKSLDGTCPMGPWIVSKDHVPHPYDLEIKTKVNGETRQHARTSLFLFPIDEIIATISKGITLEPGDIIATGTPAGVGKGFKPPRYLKDGDVIEITIESIGTLKSIISK